MPQMEKTEILKNNFEFDDAYDINTLFDTQVIHDALKSKNFCILCKKGNSRVSFEADCCNCSLK